MSPKNNSTLSELGLATGSAAAATMPFSKRIRASNNRSEILHEF